MRRIASIEKRRLAQRRFDEDIALVDLRARMVHSLNAPAALLWSAISKGSTDDDLVGLLCETYEVDPAAARRDVDAFVDTLAREGLVTIASDESDDTTSTPPR